uniref:Uncharacterized protein n=1 Tax=Tetranychus urticae TaxID=32264 RepID=T1KVQ6_TETUR
MQVIPSGSGDCAKNNLVTAKFTVIQKNDPNEYIQLTLTGYSIEPKATKTIAIDLQDPSGLATAYSCYKPSSGSTSCKVVKDAVEHVTGTSSYSNDVLSCTWVFNADDDIWPTIHKKPVDLINDNSLAIVLKYGEKKVTVAEDTSELPIYKVKFLKCCYKVHGNENFVLTFKQSDHVEYFLQVTKDTAPPSQASVILIDPSGIEIMFTCYFGEDGYLSANILAHGNGTSSVSKQLYRQQLGESRCTWASPLAFTSETGVINTTNTKFDLQVLTDDTVVYSEEGVYLGNNASSLRINFTIIMTLIMTILCKIYHFNEI